MSWKILRFSLLCLFFVTLSTLFTAPVIAGSSISWATCIDFFTPFFLIPAYWSLFALGNEGAVRRKEAIIFVAVCILWISGHGIHLASNSVSFQFTSLMHTKAYALNYFYDEVLGHYLWGIATISLSSLLIWRQWKHPFQHKQKLHIEILAGLLYGFTCFAGSVEGQISLFTMPYTVMVIVFVLLTARKNLSYQPVTTFFFVAHAWALLLLTSWAIYWQGMPQFSELLVGH